MYNINQQAFEKALEKEDDEEYEDVCRINKVINYCNSVLYRIGKIILMLLRMKKLTSTLLQKKKNSILQMMMMICITVILQMKKMYLILFILKGKKKKWKILRYCLLKLLFINCYLCTDPSIILCDLKILYFILLVIPKVYQLLEISFYCNLTFIYLTISYNL